MQLLFKTDIETLNAFYNDDDSVLSLAIKYCPDENLFRLIAGLQFRENDEIVNAITDSTLGRLTTDEDPQQTLFMMASKRGLLDIIGFLKTQFPQLNVITK